MLVKILGPAALVVVYVIARFSSPSTSIASDIVVLLTACVIVWYTIETSEIRKQGDKRAAIEAAPVIGLEVGLAENRSVPDCVLIGTEAKSQTKDPQRKMLNDARLEVRNHTRNPAILRVLLRLKTSAGIGRYKEKAYSGHVDWQLSEFRGINGHFSLLRLLASAQGQEDSVKEFHVSFPDGDITWPADEEMQLDVQVAVYDTERQLRRVRHEEYHVTWSRLKTDPVLWPEISPATLERLPWPDRLPEGKLELK